MDNEIRICFSLFVGHMKSTLKNLPEYEYGAMAIQQIKAELEVIYMKYILLSSFSISESSVGVVAYRHLKKMIEYDEMKTKYVNYDNIKEPFEYSSNTVEKWTRDEIKTLLIKSGILI